MGCDKKKSRRTHFYWCHSCQKAKIFQCAWPWFHQPESEHCTSKLCVSPSVCLSAPSVWLSPVLLSLGDRSEVADQTGGISAWCNSVHRGRPASCDLLGNFAALPETRRYTPVACCADLFTLSSFHCVNTGERAGSCLMNGSNKCTCAACTSANLHINTARTQEINIVCICVLCHLSSADTLQSGSACVCVRLCRHDGKCHSVIFRTRVEQADLRTNPSHPHPRWKKNPQEERGKMMVKMKPISPAPLQRLMVGSGFFCVGGEGSD